MSAFIIQKIFSASQEIDNYIDQAVNHSLANENSETRKNCCDLIKNFLKAAGEYATSGIRSLYKFITDILLYSFKTALHLIPYHSCLQILNSKKICAIITSLLTIQIFWTLYNCYSILFRTSENIQIILSKYYERMYISTKSFFQLSINDLKYQGLSTYISLFKDLVKVTEYTKSYTEGLFFTYALQSESRMFLKNTTKIESLMSTTYFQKAIEVFKGNPPQPNYQIEIGNAIALIPNMDSQQCIKGSLAVMSESVQNLFSIFNIPLRLLSLDVPYKMTLLERINEIPVKTIDLFIKAANQTGSDVLLKFVENKERWEILKEEFRLNTYLFNKELDQELIKHRNINKEIFMKSLFFLPNKEIKVDFTLTINFNYIYISFMVMLMILPRVLNYIKRNRNTGNNSSTTGGSSDNQLMIEEN